MIVETLKRGSHKDSASTTKVIPGFLACTKVDGYQGADTVERYTLCTGASEDDDPTETLPTLVKMASHVTFRSVLKHWLAILDR